MQECQQAISNSRINDLFQSSRSLINSLSSGNAEADLHLPVNRVDPFDLSPGSPATVHQLNSTTDQTETKQISNAALSLQLQLLEDRLSKLGGVEAENAKLKKENKALLDAKLQLLRTVEDQNHGIKIKTDQQQRLQRDFDKLEARHDSLEKSNADLKNRSTLELEQSDRYKERCHQAELKLETLQRLHGVYKARLAEYDQCCAQLGIIGWLDRMDECCVDENGEQSTAVDGLLLKAVRTMERDLADCKRRNRMAMDKYQHLYKQYSKLIQRYQADLLTSEETVRGLHDELEKSANRLDVVISERDSAVVELKSRAQEIAAVNGRFRDLSRKFQEETQELVVKQRQQLVHLESQWSDERQKYHQELAELKQGKVNLQVQLGHLIRQRAAYDAELGELQRSMDLKRNAFRRDVLKI